MFSKDLREAMLAIADSITRKKGTFDLVAAPPGESQPFSLVAGSFRAVKVPGGFAVVLGLSRDKVQALRDQCDLLLKGSGGS